MGTHLLLTDSDNILTLHLDGQFCNSEFHAMLTDVRSHFDRASAPMRILLVRHNFGFPPTDAQIETGKLLRHPGFGKIAVVGQPLFGGAVTDVMSALGGKRFQYFDTPEDARAFLLAAA